MSASASAISEIFALALTSLKKAALLLDKGLKNFYTKFQVNILKHSVVITEKHDRQKSLLHPVKSKDDAFIQRLLFKKHFILKAHIISFMQGENIFKVSLVFAGNNQSINFIMYANLMSIS